MVDESKCLDTPIWEFSTIFEHLPFLHWYKQILHQLLVLRNLTVWIWYPWLLLLSFVMLMILVQWIMHKTPNRRSQYHLGVQLDLCISDALPQIQHFWNDMSISEANWTFAPFVLASSITSFLLLIFVKFHAEIFSKFSIRCSLLPLLREFSWLEAWW